MTNKEGHYRLWDELAKTGEEDKWDAFVEVFGHDEFPHNCCFACEAATDLGTVSCSRCPIDDTEGNDCLGGLYREWSYAHTADERKRLAAIIRDLPWRDK